VHALQDQFKLMPLLTMLLSVVLHGVTANPLVRVLAPARWAREADAQRER
jgi:NhaP-type Na+/H+ or K+/H+ antiporter